MEASTFQTTYGISLELRVQLYLQTFFKLFRVLMLSGLITRLFGVCNRPLQANMR